MIFFEENIFYPKNHRVDHIKLSDTQIIHYKVSSSIQQDRWFIAVTLEENGNVLLQQPLSKQLKNYGECTSYITQLPRIIKEKLYEVTLDNEMKVDFDKVCDLFVHTLNQLNLFRNKYNL